MNIVVVGIDVGLRGACAVLTLGELTSVQRLPICPNGSQGKFKNWLDVQETFKMLWRIKEDVKFRFKEYRIVSIIEQPYPAPGQHISTTAITFDTFGVLRGLCGAMGFDQEFVAPSVWKRAFGLKREDKTETDSEFKRKSIDLCLQFYPMAPITKANEHDLAEACLLARYHWNAIR